MPVAIVALTFPDSRHAPIHIPRTVLHTQKPSPHPPVIFEYVSDADNFVVAIARHLRTRKLRRVLFPGFLAAAAIIAIASIYVGITTSSIPLALCGIIGLPLIGLSSLLGLLVSRIRHSRSPHCGEALTITLSSDGLHCVSDKQDSKRAWNVFTSAHRFSDGFVLKQANHSFDWLPDSAIQPPATIGDAMSLIAAYISDVQHHKS